MSLPLRLAAEARAELREAARHYERERPGLGLAFVLEAARLFARIARHPDAGSPVHGVRHRLTARRVTMARFPYSVMYVSTGGELRVLALAHHRRMPGYWTLRESTERYGHAIVSRMASRYRTTDAVIAPSFAERRRLLAAVAGA